MSMQLTNKFFPKHGTKQELDYTKGDRNEHQNQQSRNCVYIFVSKIGSTVPNEQRSVFIQFNVLLWLQGTGPTMQRPPERPPVSTPRLPSRSWPSSLALKRNGCEVCRAEWRQLAETPGDEAAGPLIGSIIWLPLSNIFY